MKPSFLVLVHGLFWALAAAVGLAGCERMAPRVSVQTPSVTPVQRPAVRPQPTQRTEPPLERGIAAKVDAQPRPVSPAPVTAGRAPSVRPTQSAKAPPPPAPHERVMAACRALAGELAAKLPKNTATAVLPFTDARGGVPQLGVLASAMLEAELAAMGLKIVERKLINTLRSELQFHPDDVAGGKSLALVSNITSAEYVVCGRVLRAGKQVILDAWAASPKSTETIRAKPKAIAMAGLEGLMCYVRRPKRTVAVNSLPPLAIRYEFVTRTDSGEARLADGGTVRSRQRFKIRVQPNSDCHLYVLLYDSAGKPSVLFPHAKINMTNEARGQVSYEIPEGTKWYYFDDNPGAETFYVVASYTPLTNLDGLLAKMQEAGQDQLTLAKTSRTEIETVVTRGMSSKTAGDFQLEGYRINERGVGGVVDVGWRPGAAGDTRKIDDVITGHATVVKKLTLTHR